MSIIDLAKTANPGAPASGFSRLYVAADGYLHVILDNGTDMPLGISVSNGSGAPVDAKYLMLGLSDGLTNERVFSTGEGLEYVDGGPGGILEMRLGAHKLKHAIGGSDPLTPSDIGSADAVHTHDWSDITNPPSAGAGDMTKATYDTDNDGKVEAADAADTVPWTGVSGKPATFPPNAHTHDDRYYTETELNTSGAGGQVHWDNVTNKPSTGTGDMTRNVYDPDLDGKVESADAADTVPWTGVQNPPATYPPSAHTHPFGIEAVLGTGSDVVPTGILGYVVVPFTCTIQSCTLIADAAGSITVNIWKGTGAKPTSSAQSIVASAKPALSSADYAINTTLTGWTVSLSAGDVLAFNVEASSTVMQVTLALRGVRE